jgi:capsular polysaccharide biosynthesis protein
MELKEYFKIIRKNVRLFLLVACLVFFGGVAYFYFQPVSYKTSLAINITRLNFQETENYRFDNFYRFQADEKFAETIVEWLINPRMVYDIYLDSGIDVKKVDFRKLSKLIKGEKKSSQIVVVNFSAPTEEIAKKISDNLVNKISKNTEALNKNQKQTEWFDIIAEKPLTIKKTNNYKIIFPVFLLIGLIVAFWVIMFKHYLE